MAILDCACLYHQHRRKHSYHAFMHNCLRLLCASDPIKPVRLRALGPRGPRRVVPLEPLHPAGRYPALKAMLHAILESCLRRKAGDSPGGSFECTLQQFGPLFCSQIYTQYSGGQ